jgi:hypothetical protein
VKEKNEKIFYNQFQKILGIIGNGDLEDRAEARL